MRTTIYVGNLSVETTRGDLYQTFRRFGPVTQIRIAEDPETGVSRAFAFVEMAEGAAEAVDALDGCDLHGRTLKVTGARVQDVRPGAEHGRRFY